MDLHLNSDQIDELLQSATDSKPHQVANRDHLEDARRHLKDCATCQTRIRAHEHAIENLALLKPTTPGAKSPICPPDDIWLDMAAGIVRQDSESHLNHAAQCDHCGPLLRQAKEDFADELTSEEVVRLAALRSTNLAWQRAMAARLIDGPDWEEGVRTHKRRFASLTSIAWFQGFAVASIVTVVALAAFWLTSHHPVIPEPGQLLASAYVEERTIETRFEGAGYAPLRQVRGDTEQDRMRRPALLKAEAEIAQKLKADPEDVRWLQASGRASLLEQDGHAPENAVSTLEKAHRLAPENLSITIDLASAYIVRGETGNRPEDFGMAVNLLGSVLASKPQNDVAQFNYAIALEKQLLKRRALEAWQTFLKDNPNSKWASEARDHLEKLQREVTQRDHRSSKRLKSPQGIVAALESRNNAEIADIDDHIEEYQDLVVENWLPQLLVQNPPSPQSHEITERALSGLAALLETRHKDRWLGDLLRSNRRSPQIRQAMQLLATSERMMQYSDDDKAYEPARRALSLFEQTQVPSGMVRARFATIFISQLGHRNLECAEPARRLAVSAQAHGYAWIAIQAEMESGFCASMSDASGLESVQHAIEMARAHRYPILVSRATNGASALFWALGDRHKAWTENAASLRAYWVEDTPSLRGYNLLANLDDIVQEQQQWFLAAAVLRESIPMIADDPDLGMRAFEQARLGKVLLRSGDLDGAEKSFRETQRLFHDVPAGQRRDTLSAEAELGLAKAQMERGDPLVAVNLLKRIGSVIDKVPEDDLRLDYFETSGIASLRAGDLAAAQSNLDAALELTEKGLRLVNSENDRMTWSRRNAPAYRAMVELTLQTDPTRALAYWEWYKGASLRGRSRPPSPRTFSRLATEQSTIPPGTAVLSYIFFAHGAVVWVWDSHGIRERQIDASEGTLDVAVRRFIEHCSDESSNIETLRQESAEIYRQILLPIEPWIAGNHQLIFEPDGILKSLPLEALLDAKGQYLNDRFAITVSPGMEYLTSARKWKGISAASAAFVLGDPIVPGWAPLPDAEQEARTVASNFTHPRLSLHDDLKEVNIAREISNAEVFHFSGHASAGALSAGIVVGENGLFDAWKLGDVDHGHNQLVVLSACDTSPGTSGAFDDEDSLVEQLASAGVPAVVASRWPVDSAATAALMSNFYSKLLTGETVSEAFRSASIKMRSTRLFAHPFFWAGFAVFGRV